jgi:uncharacterized metal-binding protein YceD (DUF177 family)
MTDVLSALSRPVSVTDIPQEGVDVTVEARPEEREALACDFKLPAIHSLTGAFHVTGTRSRVHVSGRVDARIEQICVVTLDPFENEVHEDVEVDFAASAPAAAQGEDPPDEIVGGTVDLGALTAEFLVLGLDPHPRKPGVDFSFEAADDRAPSPFAALEKLKRDE